jgi:cytochrome c553
MRELGPLFRLTLFALVTIMDDANAADVTAGRAKARQACQTCRGLDGLSRIPNAPHIAGHPEMYLVAQLEAYRSGARQNEMMTVVAQDLSDDDIANLSAYYSQIEVSAKVPDGS